MIWNYISRHMLKHNDSLLFTDTQKYTYQETLNIAIGIGQELKRDYLPKSKVVILCKDELYSAVALLACLYAGMVAVPASMRYGDKHYQSIIELTNANLIITDCEDIVLKSHNLYLIQTRKHLRKNKQAISSDIPSDVVLLMCTSGTTGTPKAVMITECGLMENIKSILMYFKISPLDTIMIPRPIYHCAVLTGELLVSLITGADIYFYSEKYNPLRYAQKITAYNITVLCGTPTMFGQLILSLRKKEQINLRVIALSGECLSESTATKIQSYFKNTEIYHVYGLTEASPRISFLSPEKFRTKPTSVGKALNDITITVRDAKQINKVLGINQVGVILIKTPSCMKGYYKNTKHTEKAILNGWLNTNDIGYIDNDGDLFICSRADNMIIKAGMNIYPSEIENAVTQLDVIEDALAYGIKDDSGEHIALEIATKHAVSEKELRQMLINVLPDYQMPRWIFFVDNIPKGPTGKKIRVRNNQND